MNRRPKCIRDDDLISRLVIWAVLKIFQISWNLQNSGDSVFTKTADQQFEIGDITQDTDTAYELTDGDD